MAKKGGTQTVVNTPDAFTQKARGSVWGRAQEAANQPFQPYQGQMTAGVNPMTMQGLEGAFGVLNDFQNFQPGSFLSGDIGAYMNPYQDQVIQGVQGDYDRMRGQVSNQVNDAATRARAFGGSRHGIMQGTALADVARAEGQHLGQLRSQGYNDAASRMGSDQDRMMAYQHARLGSAGQMANLGLAGGGYLRGVEQDALNAQYQQYMQGQNWDRNQAGFLSGILSGTPQGSTQTTEMPGSVLGGLLGTGLAVGSMFLPGGGLAAGAAGSGGSPFFEWGSI